MKKVISVFGVLVALATTQAHADVPQDLRGRPAENKLVIHACETNMTNCSVLSDINYSSARSDLTQRLGQPVIVSEESIDVKKGGFWVTCDAEDGDCIESTMGAFDRPVTNYFQITSAQQSVILEKLVENTSSKNTHIYFIRDQAIVAQRAIQGIRTSFDLKKTQIVVK